MADYKIKFKFISFSNDHLLGDFYKEKRSETMRIAEIKFHCDNEVMVVINPYDLKFIKKDLDFLTYFNLKSKDSSIAIAHKLSKAIKSVLRGDFDSIRSKLENLDTVIKDIEIL